MDVLITIYELRGYTVTYNREHSFWVFVNKSTRGWFNVGGNPPSLR